jgi:hypothetical protein
MARTSSNNSRRPGLFGKATASGIDDSRNSSRSDGAEPGEGQGTDSLPRPAAFVGNTLLWAKLWLQHGAPAEWATWAYCHHIIHAKLAPFIKEYLAAEDKAAVLERYGV